MSEVTIDHHVQNLVQFFERLTPHHLPQLAQLYASDAWFKDPFNEVNGTPAITKLFEHMYQALEEPHFVIQTSMTQGQQAFLTWEFRFRFKRFDQENWQSIHGASHLIFNEQGKVVQHRDYWDTAEELYEKIPLLAGLMRWLKRRVNA